MENFRTLEQAKNDLQEIQQYVDLIENYNPQNITQIIVFSYTLYGNISETAEFLNQQNYKIDGRNIEPRDIDQHILSTPVKDDLLHKQVQTLYFNKTRVKRIASMTYSYN